MWKKVLVIVGGVALAIALPLAALAITIDDVPDGDLDINGGSEAGYQEEYSYGDEQDTAQEPIYERQQLRVHAETGPPEGFEPIQQRLHQNDQNRLGAEVAPMTHERPDHARAEQHRGNLDAPMGDGTGDCDHEGEPRGSGPHGPGGSRG